MDHTLAIQTCSMLPLASLWRRKVACSRSRCHCSQPAIDKPSGRQGSLRPQRRCLGQVTGWKMMRSEDVRKGNEVNRVARELQPVGRATGWFPTARSVIGNPSHCDQRPLMICNSAARILRKAEVNEVRTIKQHKSREPLGDIVCRLARVAASKCPWESQWSPICMFDRGHPAFDATLLPLPSAHIPPLPIKWRWAARGLLHFLTGVVA